ncbi:DUF2306 domain-containing protein [Phenylobacterium sp.]|uniref:DUF2306 domain-containing protein n=1 Tax=Phenylobacterium sp. TaxID=1871053 RepID=UPI0035B38DB0
MSQISETQAKRRMGFAPRMLASTAAAAAIVGLALGPAWTRLGDIAARAQFHGPDPEVWARLSPAIRVHLLAALAALGLGAVLMAARKGRRFHRLAGWGWVALVAVTALSSLFITSLNRGGWSILHLFTGWTLIALPLAVVAARRHRVVRHRRTMMGLFYGGFALNLFVAMIPGRALWALLFG